MEALGINPVLLIAQIISFLVLWFVLNKFLFRHIQKALEDRRDSVKKIYSDKEELENRILRLEKEQEEKRIELHLYGKRMENEAKKAANVTRKKIVAQATAEGERELKKARERIEQEATVAQKTLTREVFGVAREMAEKIIREKSQSGDWQNKELEKSLEAMRKQK